MFNLSNKKIIVLALIFGLCTALAVNVYLGRVKAALNNIETGAVVIAKVPIPAKTELKAEELETRQIPREFIHPRAVADPKDLLGKITVEAITAGEQVLTTRIVDTKDLGKGLAYIIPKGRRAISVGVNQITGISNLIQPGDRVDVVGLMDIEAGQADGAASGGAEQNKTVSVAKIILQDLQVLAVDQKLDPSGRLPEGNEKNAQEGKTVTLAVKPEDAEKLVLVTERGIIRLILRSPVEQGTYVPKPYSPKDFLVR